jgi:hypothetical protein
MYINFMLKFIEESVKGRFSSEDGEEIWSSVWLSVSYVYYPIKTNTGCILSYWCTIFAAEMLNDTKGLKNVWDEVKDLFCNVTLILIISLSLFLCVCVWWEVP